MKLAIDVMGGDDAPNSILEGIILFLKDNKYNVEKIFLVGDEQLINNYVNCSKLIEYKSILEVVHSKSFIAMQEAPTVVLRSKKDSSINKAIFLVKEKKADAVISAGNTGATATSSIINLKMVEGVKRPAIATIMPKVMTKGEFMLLDVGATVEPSTEYLVHCAVLSDIFSKNVLKKKNPKIALLNIGEEESKGDSIIKQTYEELQKLDINFVGNIEGNELFNRDIDIVLCNGFVGNIVLKTIEGTAKTMSNLLKNAFKRNIFRKILALLSNKVFKEVKEISAYDQYGGAPLLGVNGICIISHGRSSPKAIQSAITVACESVQQKLNQKASNSFKNLTNVNK